MMRIEGRRFYNGRERVVPNVIARSEYIKAMFGRSGAIAAVADMARRAGEVADPVRLEQKRRGRIDAESAESGARGMEGNRAS